MAPARFTFRQTRYACYLGYVTQAIINNLAPLLFLTFHRQFGISLERIGILVSVNFGVQILTDLVAAKMADKLGYRISAVAAHLFAVAGLVSLCILPGLFKDAFIGLAAAMAINAIGGGLLEVLVSPIVEALPGDRKASAMSLLHSFYCWGHVAVVLLSTLYFFLFGLSAWRFLPLLWAILPLFNAFLFLRVPLQALVAERERVPLRRLFRVRLFWLLLFLMICAGASEQAMSQWSSLFAEAGLGVGKAMGDLLGPCAFAACMGIARTWFGVQGARLRLERILALSGMLCVLGYLVTVFAPWPLLSLAGCSICGLSVAFLWPGVFSLAGRHYRNGGTAMFAMLALGGDIGCAAGPALVGIVSDAVTGTSTGLKAGLLLAVVFPMSLVAGIRVLTRSIEKSERLSS